MPLPDRHTDFKMTPAKDGTSVTIEVSQPNKDPLYVGDLIKALHHLILHIEKTYKIEPGKYSPETSDEITQLSEHGRSVQ